MSATVELHYGAIAQLVERLNRTQEVSGSTPLSSTPFHTREHTSQNGLFSAKKAVFYCASAARNLHPTAPRKSGFIRFIGGIFQVFSQIFPKNPLCLPAYCVEAPMFNNPSGTPMGKRTYSDTEKATALALLDANDGNLSSTQRATGVPRSTLREWRDGRHNGEVADIRREKKVELAGLYEQFQRDVFEHGVTEEKIKATPLKDLMTACGIAADKMIALRGQTQPDAPQANVFVQMNQEVKDTPGFPRK